MRLALISAIAGSIAWLQAAETPPAPKPDGWSVNGKFGFWFQGVSSSHADTSRDPTISTASNTLNYAVGGEVNALWKRSVHEVEQNLKTKYGRQRQDDGAWITASDEINYQGVYRTVWTAPQFTYIGWGTETVFVGPAPQRDAFGQGRSWVSAGYGLKREPLFMSDAKGEIRAGVRGQKKWGDGYTDRERQATVGPEWFARYEAKLKTDVKCYAQYEGTSDFKDMHHVTNLVTAGIFVQLSKYFTLDVAYRAYEEERPKYAVADAPGYGQWSMRSETLIGLVYSF